MHESYFAEIGLSIYISSIKPPVIGIRPICCSWMVTEKTLLHGKRSEQLSSPSRAARYTSRK